MEGDNYTGTNSDMLKLRAKQILYIHIYMYDFKQINNSVRCFQIIMLVINVAVIYVADHSDLI